MSGAQEDREQRIIDHEVRLSRAREAVAHTRGKREGRSTRRAAAAEQAWHRENVISMLGSVATEQELQELGLSDDVVQEVGLGDSLLRAWKAFRRVPPEGARAETPTAERPPRA